MVLGRKSFEGWIAALAESVLRDRSTDRVAWLEAPTETARRSTGRRRRRHGAGPDEPTPPRR